VSLLATTVLYVSIALSPHAQAQQTFTTEDTHVAISAAAHEHGVAEWLLDCMAMREATYRPYAVGSRGEQGVAQLKSPGRRDDFYARGYTDPFNPYQAIDYQALSIREGAGPAWTGSYFQCGGQ
jgi:hypothetical protein